MEHLNTLVILGSYSLAREFYFHTIESTSQYQDFIFVNDLDDGQFEVFLNNKNYNVVKDWKFDEPYPFIVAIGNPQIKMRMVEMALESGLYPAETVIHPTARVQDKETCKIGKGGLISPNCILTTNISVGDYVTLNLATTVGHDTKIGNFSTTNPGVHISGFVNIGERVEIGTGACIKNNTNIASDNMIGAQCVVVKHIEDSDGVYIGVPSKKLRSLKK
jgi:sugar O-acyltransferase (sialic acid O-acetyltransferase NeuD family)